MGKKSLTKSTTGSKKNTAAQKKGTRKKSEDKKPEKNAKTKNPGAGKSASKKTAKKPALKTLRKKKFETWIPENPYVPESGTDTEHAFTAPEITGDYDKKDAEKIRTLLFKKIDLAAIEPEKPGVQETENPGQTEPEKSGPETVEEKTEKPALKTLLKKKFETWVPENPYVPQSGTDTEHAFTAPEITGDYEQKDAEKIRTLLFKKIDLAAIEPEKPGMQETENTGQTEPEKPGPETVEEKTEKPAQEQPPGGGGTSGGGGGQPPRPPGGTGGGGMQLPISKGMLGAICAVAVIFVLIIGASIKNMDTYYLEEKRNSLEIWRGEFSPAGKEKVVTLPGVEASKPLKDKYSRQDALTLAFEYFMGKADDVTGEQDIPDLKSIKDNLENAKKYAVTDKQKELVNSRLNRIEYLKLIYRADVAAENQTEQGYETALDFLEKAGDLKLSEHDRQALKQRADRIRENLEKLREESGNKGDSK